jgi:hypothetical protein
MEGSPLWDNERLIFVVLAAFVWVFIVRTVYETFWRRRQLQEQVAGLSSALPEPEDDASKEKTE